ncbi:MBL fold metallo-hydrolase [Mangrovimicrobium sediminis]|uniref:MBL fold metallo-hydrolase n=1 Tax=Mangrovimicrobium sediminis TaxID=2562682 RepID=A0A4Z0LW19_9GAMM|nr:MBL fold metallo-hydrolase [Haliea sp. SAOS-164]TGD71338.1 MBL fold metallo-hydrolase [Haliea sp. SAOS-164]
MSSRHRTETPWHRKPFQLCAFLAALGLSASAVAQQADTCLDVILTGTKGGPNVYGDLAGPGTLVSFGRRDNNCRDLLLQFDAGRATSIRLAQLGIMAGDLDALFLTHTHSDHVQGLADLMQLRWHYYSERPPLDMVSTVDVRAPGGHTLSAGKLAAHIAAPFLASGEIAQRHAERPQTAAEGPAALLNPILVERPDKPTAVWRSGAVVVSAIASTHTANHLSYRVDTPAGSVVIGGDASSDTRKPPREHSTSAQVELLAQGADVLVHSTTHPVMGPEAGGGMPAPIFYRQSTATDLGAMAQRAGISHYLLTHLTPSLGEVPGDEGWAIPGAPLDAGDFKAAVRVGGFTGTIVVGPDLVGLRLPEGLALQPPAPGSTPAP